MCWDPVSAPRCAPGPLQLSLGKLFPVGVQYTAEALISLSRFQSLLEESEIEKEGEAGEGPAVAPGAATGEPTPRVVATNLCCKWAAHEAPTDTALASLMTPFTQGNAVRNVTFSLAPGEVAAGGAKGLGLAARYQPAPNLRSHATHTHTRVPFHPHPTTTTNPSHSHPPPPPPPHTHTRMRARPRLPVGLFPGYFGMRSNFAVLQSVPWALQVHTVFVLVVQWWERWAPARPVC
jgi:hypothetical protein